MQVAAKYGDQAPMAAVCCNACRTCTTTNLLALATGMGLVALYAVGRFGQRVVRGRGKPRPYAFCVNQQDASASR